MSGTSAAQRLRQIAEEMRALPTVLKQFGAGEIASAAGGLLDETIQLGAFPADADPEYARLKQLIARQKRMAAERVPDDPFPPLDWRIGAWDEAVTCLCPELRAGRLGWECQDACAPIADLIDAEAARLAQIPPPGQAARPRKPDPKPAYSEKDDKRLAQDWEAARRQRAYKGDFAKQKGHSLKDFNKLLARVRKRRYRKRGAN